jgi:hypothetical protein
MICRGTGFPRMIWLLLHSLPPPPPPPPVGMSSTGDTQEDKKERQLADVEGEEGGGGRPWSSISRSLLSEVHTYPPIYSLEVHVAYLIV